MPKKKILHITLATGGVKTYVSHVLEHANAGKFEFVVVAPANELFEAFCRERSIAYYIADLDRNNSLFFNLELLFRMIRIIKKEKPDLIHAHSAKGGFIGRLAAKFVKTRLIYTPHAFSYLSFVGLKRMVFYLMEYMVKKQTTLLLAISHTEANCAIYQLGFPKDSVSVILNSISIIDLAEHDYARPIQQICMIGRLTIQKNPMLFLQIAKKLVGKYPHLVFSILGAGIHDDLKTEIDNYVEHFQLGKNVRIENWAAHSSKFLEQADLYVSTSVFEGLPFSLLEAMLHGVPCIVSKVDGNIDVIQNNENGFSCLSIKEFCEKIEDMIENQGLRRQIGNAGRNYVVQYHNIASAIKKLEEVYQNI
ncbi:glycosyltransferase family 1 protein [Pedobacter chinensis]|uniref:Glycosyltransferase family 1 protein n=1 Tax=Pedobacter chinensis TaxID=2282421 RepID=A0A369PTH7_9SPHI|nr:glycosyltransferase [Pedobacter chinensis]RDC55834.1 glycosyltransferase family 1 protein [Pedobacter chinensis]